MRASSGDVASSSVSLELPNIVSGARGVAAGGLGQAVARKPRAVLPTLLIAAQLAAAAKVVVVVVVTKIVDKPTC